MKNSIRLIWCAFVLVLASQNSHAQVSVTGKVTDKFQEGVPGATVQLKGTTTGTITDNTGEYSLTVPDRDASLIFSFIGYKTKVVAVENNSQINVILEIDISELESVVVIGYGSQRKQDITGAVAVVNTEDRL